MEIAFSLQNAGYSGKIMKTPDKGLNRECGIDYYEFYVNEKIRANDPKGTGPFILASLALDR